MNNNSNNNQCEDVFAKIATQSESDRAKALVEPMPPRLPQRVLPSRKHDPHAAFKLPSKLDSKEKLQKELFRQRRLMSRYLRDLAPTLPKTRKVLKLRSFDHRLETSQDTMNFTTVLDGRGKWQEVSIPHYGGPLGRGTAYYRTTFALKESDLKNKACWIRFKGVDYKAHVFINGAYVGSHEGFFAPFEFDFSKVARCGANVLVVKVENDAIFGGNMPWGGADFEGDKIYAATGLGYDEPEIGWHHCPPGMGIYQDVCVEGRSKIFINDIFVRPVPSEEKAEVWIELESSHLTRQEAAVEISIFGQNFRKQVVRIAPQDVEVGPGRNYYRFALNIPKPRLWDTTSPWLYQVQVRLLNKNGRRLDSDKRQFGMREFSLDTKSTPKGSPRLNGRDIRLRGANTMGHLQQCVFKGHLDQLRDDILLAKICNMNFLRLTQRPVQLEIYEMCDQLGLMTQTDLPLFGVVRRNKFAEVVRQAEEMERLVRSHPCNIMITYINEPYPREYLKAHRHLQRNELESLFLAADRAVHLANPDRVIKHVDGDYDPPTESLPDNHCYNFWYNGHGLGAGKLIKGYWQKVKPGWNYACGEFGVEGLDPVEIMFKHYPPQWLPESMQEKWSPHRIPKSQTRSYHHMWFATPETITEWVTRSQEYQAWAVRTMTEAFRRDQRMVSFALHLFIDAFPSGWMKAIMDVDRNPKPAFFAYRDALSPIAANIRTDRDKYFAGEKLDMEFWICNDLDQSFDGYEICYQIRHESTTIFARRAPARIEATKPCFQGFFRFQLPDVKTRSAAYVDLAIRDSNGRVIHSTSQKLEVFPNIRVSKRRILVVGKKNGNAWSILRELGLEPVRWNNKEKGIIVADSIDKLLDNKDVLEKAVNSGARLVITGVGDGRQSLINNKSLKFSGSTIEFLGIQHLGPRYFVDCSTGHSIVSDFNSADMFMWNNYESGMIEPILSTVFRTQNMETILATKSGTRYGPWKTMSVAAMKQCGKGHMVVSTVLLKGMLQTNPIAKQYAIRLLGL